VTTIHCKQCGKPCKVYTSRGASARFCSFECYRPASFIRCRHCNKECRVPPSIAKAKRFCSRDCYVASEMVGKPSRNFGNVASASTRKAISRAVRGRKFSTLHRKRIGDAQRGPKGGNFIDGRRCFKNAWRAAVNKRDSYRCRACGVTKNLDTHHIKPRRTHPHLKYEVSNGITLCDSCHRKYEGTPCRFPKAA
jgi:hypothetical protein